MNEPTYYTVNGVGATPVESVLFGPRRIVDGDVVGAGEALRARIEKKSRAFDESRLSAAAKKAIERLELTAERAEELGLEGLTKIDGVGEATARSILQATDVGSRIVIPWLRHATEQEIKDFLGAPEEDDDAPDVGEEG